MLGLVRSTPLALSIDVFLGRGLHWFVVCGACLCMHEQGRSARCGSRGHSRLSRHEPSD